MQHYWKEGREEKEEKAEKTRAVIEEVESEWDSNSVGKGIEEDVGALPDVTSKSREIFVTPFDHGTPSKSVKVKLLIDSEMNKTMLSKADWKKIKA